MTKQRNHHSPEFKFQVVMELISWRMTQSEIISTYGVHATQQNKRKKEFLERWPALFYDKRTKQAKEKDREKQVDHLYKQIGQLTVERDWLQKKIGWLPPIRL